VEAMRDYLHKLFRYDEWANREILTQMRSMDPSALRAIQLLAHVLSAEQLWFERLTSREQSLPVWPECTVEQCEVLIAGLAKQWDGYFREMRDDELQRVVHYKNSKGEVWESRVEDVLMHVVMHSGYHRGQIAAEMRASGNTPAYTDFIHAVRKSLVK
jgi:uncharacterized damage-inducible protein DinB